MKYKIGQKVRIGGSRGMIMTISDIQGDDMILVAPGCTFFYHVGDCSLVPYKSYEQLSLFDNLQG